MTSSGEKGGTPDQWQDSESWKALPYEASGAMVRSLMLHLHKLREAKDVLTANLAHDPDLKKAATRKSRDAVQALLDVQRYLVFNPRTGQMATEAWLAKNIVAVGGKPQFKDPKKQNKSPRILTLRVVVTEPDSVTLTLDVGDEDGPRPVRCFDLSKATEEGGLKFFAEGWSYMGAETFEPDEDGLSDIENESEFDMNEYEDEIIDDSHGLAGLKLIGSLHRHAAVSFHRKSYYCIHSTVSRDRFYISQNHTQSV